MKKCIIILCCFIVLFSSISLAEEMVTSKYGKVDRQQFDLYDNATNSYESAEDFLKEVDFYVEQINNYLGIDFNSMIEFKFDDSWGTGPALFKNTITISKYYLQMDILPLAAQITHIIAKECSLPSLNEGLADYMYDKFLISTYINTKTMGFKVHSLVKAFLPKYKDELIDGIVNGGIEYSRLSSESIVYFHLFSQSFVKYLINTHGLEKVHGVLPTKMDTHSYEEYFGISKEEIKNNWLTFLQEQESVSEEEYIKRYTEIMTELRSKMQ